MIGAMPRSLPPFLQRETHRGKLYWYVRIGKGPRVRVRGAFDSPEFWSAYEAAVGGKHASAPAKAPHGTLEWLIEQYRNTAAWRSLSMATRRQRENIFKHIIAAAGRESIKAITRAVIIRGRDKRAGTPAAARNFLKTMRALFRWALEVGHVRIDPTVGVGNPPRKKGGGFPVWTEDEITAFEKRWPIGTKERVWIDTLLYTGLRRGDAVRIGRQHVRDGVATIRTEKSGGEITVTIPILPVLQATIDAGPCGDLAFICGARGEPLTKEGFGNLFRDACVRAGVNKSAHGLRKAGATRMANAGATVAQLNAIFGWVGARMALEYTSSADRAHLARQAIGMIARPDESGTSRPEHLGPAARTRKKNK